MATFSVGPTGNSRNTARFTRVITLQEINGQQYDSTTLTPFPEPIVINQISINFSTPAGSQYIPVI